MAIEVLHEEIIAPVSEDNPRNSEASVVELKDGRLLLAWSDFYGGHHDWSPAHISARYSEDGGRTWGEKLTLVENTSAMNTFGPSFLRLSSGDLALFYYHQEAANEVRQYMTISSDEGETWTRERCITPDHLRQFMINDHALQMTNGRVVLPISWTKVESWRHWGDEHYPAGQSKPSQPDMSTSAHDRYRSVCWYSDDEGESWHRGQGEVALPKRGAMEPAVVERRNGSLMMVIRSQMGDQYRSESYDGGDTWTEPRLMGLVGSEAPANIKRIPSTGDLLIVWNHVFAPYRKHFGRTPLTTAISQDDGETWEHIRDLEAEPDHYYGYPSILFREDELLLTYWRSREETTGWELKVKIVPTGWMYEEVT